MARQCPLKHVTITDIRVMANKAAQKLLVGRTVAPIRHGQPEPLNEHEVTNIIAEALQEYWAVQR